MTAFSFEFVWDSAKARINRTKHGVDFEQAAEVFRDPLALTISDEEHSVVEERWITLGRDMRGQYFLLVHTFEQLTENRVRVRVISARRPTGAEILHYEEAR